MGCRHEVDDDTIYLTLLRSVDTVSWGHVSSKMNASEGLEHGEHEFRYALLPHSGTWREAKSYRYAYEHNNPLCVVATDNHEGEMPTE